MNVLVWVSTRRQTVSLGLVDGGRVGTLLCVRFGVRKLFRVQGKEIGIRFRVSGQALDSNTSSFDFLTLRYVLFTNSTQDTGERFAHRPLFLLSEKMLQTLSLTTFFLGCNEMFHCTQRSI